MHAAGKSTGNAVIRKQLKTHTLELKNAAANFVCCYLTSGKLSF